MIHGDWLGKWSQVLADKPAIIDADTGQILTYRQLNRRADRAANLLRDQFQVGRGDRVAVLGQNRVEQVELFFALSKLGAVLVPVNWRLAPSEVAWILAQSESNLLFYGSDVAATIEKLQQGAWDRPTVPFDGDGSESYSARMNRAFSSAVSTEGVEEDTPLMLLYTSGTTGRPKGAILTHGTITWNAINTATGWDLHQDDVTLTHTPFFHTGGWNVLTLPLLHRGATVVLTRRFDAAETLEIVGKHKVTVLFAVPTMFQMMLEAGNFAAADLSPVRFFISGGAPCPIPLIEAYGRRGVTFKQGYGLTEVGPNCFVLDEKDAVGKAGSVGFPVLHLDTRLVNAVGEEAGPGEVGELHLRGPTVCAGYWKNPEATAGALGQDGWFATGDLFRRDDEGYHYVVGRLKEMYISGGENVYPAEVERVLHEIPDVVEAAVVGIPDEKWGEVGHAFVSIAGTNAGGESVNPDSILQICRQQLAKYKVPKELTIMKSLPKGSSGKILKKDLQALAAGEPGPGGKPVGRSP
jgi:fatty-acyl-CoA synthase